MSLPFELVRATLVVEIAAFLLLSTPLPHRHRRRVLGWLAATRCATPVLHALRLLFLLVLLLFGDALARSIRLSRAAAAGNGALDMQRHVKMFYAQRNMYLTGFTLVLALVLYQHWKLLATLVRQKDRLDAMLETHERDRRPRVADKDK